ncbi:MULTISPECIES: type III pantothenate kinase [Flavobacterium]|nr:type III pantothenate kinase [Flavobacterium sp. N1846]
MILTIDVGNTRIKSAVFEQNTVLETSVFLKETLEESIEKIFKKFSNIEVLVLSSVGKIDEKGLDFLFGRIKIHVIDRDQPFPFQNNYATPNTLGIDRMVLVAGAVLQFPAQNRLIIDAGTCVTYDYVDQNDVYHGGAISPGTRLRYEAMHNYTAKLPLLELEDIEKVVGNSTSNSMHSGVVNGLTFEIDGYINAIKAEKENFIIILTGGDANFLAKRLKNTIFANSNFLLESLNSLYQYQINND